MAASPKTNIKPLRWSDCRIGDICHLKDVCCINIDASGRAVLFLLIYFKQLIRYKQN